jgi:hypothetical protein
MIFCDPYGGWYGRITVWGSGVFSCQSRISLARRIIGAEDCAVQLLVGHTKLESTVRYLGIEVDDALEMAEQTEG